MPAYKEPTFQERTALARQAREKALQRLKDRPPVDEALLAERKAAREAKEKAAREKAAARKAAIEQAKAERLAKAEAVTTMPAKAQPTEEERKAARDARYAARKAKKGKKR